MTRGGDEVHLRYIRATAGALGQRAEQLGKAGWMADPHARSATYYQLQTIAEATQRLSDELKSRHPATPWRAIAGMRHRLVHGFLDVDPAIVWSVVADDVPRLGDVAARELERVRAPARPRRVEPQLGF